MNKISRIGLLTLFFLVALTLILLPPREITIEINATPLGIQEFYVEVRTSRNNLHGSTVKTLFKGLVPVKQKVNVSLKPKNLLWFGKIHAYAYHPEYYQESTSANNSYIFTSVTLSPTTWKNIISSEEKLVSQQVYRPNVLAFQDLPLTHLSYHSWFINENMVDLYLKNNVTPNVRKSIETMNQNTSLFIKKMLEENMSEHGETEEMKQEIEKIRTLRDKILKKFN